MTVMRTAGIDAMRGTWFALLDSDDLWHADKLTIQMRELERHPECGWSYTGYKHIGDDGQTVDPRTGALPSPVSGWIAEQLITFTVAASPSTLVVRRSLFDEVGGFDQALHMRSDYDLVLRLAARSEACAVTSELAMMREHSARSSNAFPVLEQFKENERVFHKAWLDAPTSRMRALCAQQRGAQHVSIARTLRHDGHRGAALVALARALAIAPRGVWRLFRQVPSRLLGARPQRAPSVS
jgi:GT2 family glycosyltransferase